jgi:hypothetical protein
MSNVKLLTSWTPLDIDKSKLREDAQKYGSDKMILRGILQKADTLNQNGRIYPKRILEREVMNYQKFIVENRALGECVPPGTEIRVSPGGWKNIEDISKDESIVTLNLETSHLEHQAISRKVEMQFDGELYRFTYDDLIDMCLTPNHKVLMWNSDGKPYKILASELAALVESGDTVSTLQTARGNVKVADLSVEIVPHKGNVYCVTVQNGTWLMRYNGKVCWTGNCDHPDSSVVSLKNASHIVREAYMDGNNVIGAVEVLPTPCGDIIRKLVESDVKIGVSSRGVGSTKKDGDVQVVQDDFILICFDCVSEPSTTSAFLLPEGVDILNSDGKHFSREELLKSLNRNDRINRIMSEIMS